MIKNERQYNVTKGQAAKLESALEASRKTRGKMPEQVYRVMIAGIESQIAELRQELREYESLSKSTSLSLDSCSDIAKLLIQARIARGMTQKDLARKLGLKSQQIQKYEATDYNSVSLRRMQEIFKALDIDFRVSIPLKAQRA